MKLLKKILCLSAILTTLVGFGVAGIACKKDKDSSSVESSEQGSFESVEGSASDSATDSSSETVDQDKIPYVYRVTLQNETGFGFSGATVKLMDGERVVATKRTNASGNANFLASEVTAGEYDIVVEDAPDGYTLPESEQKTSTESGTKTSVVIKPIGLLAGTAPAGTSYKLGDVMYDFTVTLSDNQTYTLSEVLQEKKLVLLNFWATWCTPCKSEFPAMHNAALQYTDDVSVIAISTTDGKQAVADFKAQNNYTQFNMASEGSDNLVSMFSVGSIPHTVMIDRYGVVVYNHVGSMPSVSAFTTQFDKFVGDDYVPLVIGGANEEEGTEEELPDSEQLKPNVEAPATADLNAMFQGFTFRFQQEDGLAPGDKEYDEYNWPWIISEDKTYVSPSNANIHSSYAILYSTVTVKDGDVLTFDYKVGSEANCDIFYIMIDGVPVKEYSGYHVDDWYTAHPYVFKDYEAGTHEIAFVFLKDADTTAYEDEIKMKNLRLTNVADLDKPEIDVNVFRYAATQKNEDPKAPTQYKSYVHVEYNEKDDYYHVGDINGPILYANMMSASLWNETSLWLLAFNDYIVGDGMNYHYALEDFAWEAAQITDVEGYTPVTADLQYLLDVAVRYTTFGQRWQGNYHKNEWLELCVYWEHYGQTELPGDPMAGITFTGAIEMHEGENEVSVPYKINPRGFKYKFTPEKSGAYKVYSTGYADSIVFLMADDRKTQLGYFDNKIFVEVLTDADGNDVSDDNFEFYWYFEENKTYYMLFTTYMDDLATYNVTIERLGDTYTYLENAAIGPYSANLNTFELFLPDAIDYTYSDPTKGGDGYYHHVKEDGSLGGVIYLDVNRPTAFFDSASLYDICRTAQHYEPEKRALYIDGVDYTEAFMKLCFKANRQTGKMKGFLAVDAEVFRLLTILTRSAKYDGIDNSWLLLCYYDKTLEGSKR